MKRRGKIILALVGSGIALLVGLAVYGIIDMNQGMSNPLLATAPSPVKEGAHVLLLEHGFVDRGMEVLVTTPDQPDADPRSIDATDMLGTYQFDGIRWSTDGALAIVEFIPEDAFFVAYDFSNQTITVPPPESEQGADIRATIKQLAAPHGGLSGVSYTKAEFEADAKEIWYWDMPGR